MSLDISADLSLPVDAVTGTAAILATRGAGKSNAAVVLAEEMWDNGVPWVAVDPKGDWWGIRSDGDGDHPGLPIVVFGGRHGDVPLEPTAGAMLADLVLAERLTCVLDVSQFTKADTTRFLLAFGRRLFAHADDDGAEPLHLFLEEAHEYLPQVVKGDQADLVNVWQRIVKQGRFKGLGCTLVSQRSSVLNKDVLELVDTLIVLRTIGPRSRKSIADWVADQDVDTDLLASLPGLADGEAWVWSPGALRILQRIRFRRRRTFDSGATPKVGQSRRMPATLADVDLAAIKEAMADTIERAEADDPKTLRRRIRELEQAASTVVVPTPVVTPELVADLQTAVDEFSNRGGDVLDALRRVDEIADAIIPLLDFARTQPGAHLRFAARTPERTPHAPTSLPPRSETPSRRTIPGTGDPSLGKAERSILTVLVQFPDGRTHHQIAMLTGYSPKASTIGVALSKLRKLDLVEASTTGGVIRATPGADEHLGDYEVLPTGQALYAYWRAKVGKAERLILDELVSIWPDTSTQDQLAEVTGYSPSASTIGVGLSKLRKLGLVDGWKASDEFMDSTR